jgi:hypothetical protein
MLTVCFQINFQGDYNEMTADEESSLVNVCSRLLGLASKCGSLNLMKAKTHLIFRFAAERGLTLLDRDFDILVQQSGEKQLPELLVHRFASLNKFVKP